MSPEYGIFLPLIGVRTSPENEDQAARCVAGSNLCHVIGEGYRHCAPLDGDSGPNTSVKPRASDYGAIRVCASRAVEFDMYLILVVRIVPGDTDALEARCVRTVFFVVRHGVAAVDNDDFKCV